ncbi:hypothetical protein [Stackebrandtia nassauensis]|uniref:Uncharacterized protein n=1 Tax=Stackebrandtia nassauensis (strain DSM 44728 / CIP 108903 / NRRL B-16338 / NBRC 102104 / LLR-40K-21) TaxID=446470 RepID=D3Q978_STANL|nr:hypothetical protein [Stackebrandtia nassauensis]ADD40687.1 hypothetical protein Snas_0977 [Stackebrandtia nassauensis DSM 44728]
MAVKPSQRWREGVAEEAEELAAGTLDPECAHRSMLFPEPMIQATDAVLATFETEVTQLSDPTDGQVFACVKRVVLALNAANERFGGAAYETDEREALCAYIDQTLTEHGIDIPALAERRGINPHEITDAWRRW